MALARDLSTAQLAFKVAGGAADEFLVIRYRGSEGLCQLYRFEIELASAEGSPDFSSIVGKPATLSITSDWGPRWFHGIVSRFEMTGETADQTYFRAELVPELWLLTHRYDCRMFQEKSTKDIISEVLTAAGIASDRVDLTGLQGTYDPREYCVQYRETDYNFLCRLMEEEGIRWCFQQTEEAHTLILTDAAEYAPIAGESATLPYRPPSAMNVNEEHVFRFRVGQCVRPGKVMLADYNFENPGQVLRSESDAGRNTDLEFYDFPGEYTAEGAGNRLSGFRKEEFDSARILGVGRSNSHRLAPDLKFTLADHPSDSANGEYLITSVTHHGDQATQRASGGGSARGSLLNARTHQALLQAQSHEDTAVRELAGGLLSIASRMKAGDTSAHRALTHWLYHAGQVSRDLPATAGASGGNPLEPLAIPNLVEDLVRASIVEADPPLYECRFECIPADVTYRPPRVTPWPVMRGSQTARIVGPEGEEIHVDEYGRVKVHFEWDRVGTFGENDSCWIRVCQGWAGGNYGIMFIPRIGQEVIVDFLEGDPDKPIITGRVYNADHMPPYELPAEKTKSTIKTLSSKDGDGFNELRFEDLKGKEEIFIHAEKDYDLRVKNTAKETICNDRHLIVGNNKFEHIKKNRHEIVDADHMETICKDRHLKVEGKEAIEIAGTRSLKVAGDVADEFADNHSEQVANEYHVKATDVIIEGSTNVTVHVGDSFIAIESSGIKIGTTGDIVLDAGGNIEIKSGANSTMESGANTDVKAGAALALEGTTTADMKSPTTTVKGDGMLTLKGGVVMIN